MNGWRLLFPNFRRTVRRKNMNTQDLNAETEQGREEDNIHADVADRSTWSLLSVRDRHRARG